MRPIIIVLLVFMHSFTMFTGGTTWPLPSGIHSVELYKDLAWIAYSFMLEAFVFISGYLFSSQMERVRVKFVTLIKKKLHRLYLPSLVFSVAYFAFFLVQNHNLHNQL